MRTTLLFLFSLILPLASLCQEPAMAMDTMVAAPQNNASARMVMGDNNADTKSRTMPMKMAMDTITGRLLL